MLTIRALLPDGGEMIKEVSSVWIRPASQTARGRACLTYFGVGVGEEPRAVEDIYEGTVYVMNGSGKTVANYNLNLPEAVTGDGELVVGGSE